MINQDKYFASFMVRKINCNLLKEQQRIYIQMMIFLTYCNGEYYFFENYLLELKECYTSIKCLQIINLMISKLYDLQNTNNITKYVNECYIMNIDDLDLLYNLRKFFEDFQELRIKDD